MKSKSESVARPQGNPGAKRKGDGSGAATRMRGSEKFESSPGGDDDCPREQMIAKAAYYLAERRGFVAGNEMSDWLQAEAEVERSLCHGRR